MRNAGILMAVSSLPSKYGIGDFGKEAYKFIEALAESKGKIWQILPLNPLGYGNSPYQPYSSFAMDELYISLDLLVKEGLIEEPPIFNMKLDYIDYPQVRAFKRIYYQEAFKNFKKDDDYNNFIKLPWVSDYAHFMAFKRLNNMVCWNDWKKEDRDWINKRPAIKDELLLESIEYEMFIQYILNKQWLALKSYANQHNVKIMGDIPFYVGIDSVDVWANQKCFLLDSELQPTFIAGVPPDYFSETGQRWGNPIYDWDYLKKTKFAFWIERMKINANLYDIIRIDHFRAFDTYWKIPVTCPTAIEGEWIEAPGYELFKEIKKHLPKLEIVAEDLGDLREEVLELRDSFKLPGMKIVQFTFDVKEHNNDFEDRENMIIYTGTHDNQTMMGWYKSQDRNMKRKMRNYLKRLGFDSHHIYDNFVRYTLSSIAKSAIIPIQDLLGIDDSGRINTPGTVGSPNWEWKMDSQYKLITCVNKFKGFIEESKRD